MDEGVFSFDRPIDEAAQAYILNPSMARPAAKTDPGPLQSALDAAQPSSSSPTPVVQQQLPAKLDSIKQQICPPLVDPKSTPSDLSAPHPDPSQDGKPATSQPSTHDLEDPADPSASEVQQALREITNLKQRLQSFIAVEEEIVESETWNFDASVFLSIFADKLGGIPFGTPADFYDMNPTSDGMPIGKGKEKDIGQGSPKPVKRAVLNLDPKVFQDSWWATSLRKSLHPLCSCSAHNSLFFHNNNIFSTVPSCGTPERGGDL